MSVNKVILIGQLGGKPELKKTNSGVSVCRFSLATSERRVDKDGNKTYITEWHDVVVWGKLGEFCSQFLNKGDKAYIEGKIQSRTWEDKFEQKRKTIEIVASSVERISQKKQDQSSKETETEQQENESPEIDESGFAPDDVPF